jgi:hypothetical protein
MGGETLMSQVLLRPVFTVDGWSGNAADDDGVEWWITKEEGWASSPDVRVDLSLRPQRDGAFDAPSFRTARMITLEGTAVAPDPQTKERAKDRLAAVLADGSRLAELVVDEEITRRRAMVRLAGGTKIVDTTPYTFDWSIQLAAPDPLRYGADVHQAVCGLPTPGPGIVFPLTFPVVFAPSGTGALSAENDGTALAWPVWTITGPCNQPVIRNDSTGQWLAFGLRLLAGDVLTVDVAAHTVQVGGASRRSFLVPGSGWFGLRPGGNTISFGALDTDATAQLAVTWRDAWI